ncbi:hypothetical protein DOTSEDRAFT_135105, partial [Dothistroma septosporum NZE10]
GLWTLFYMPDTPVNAKVLYNIEKKAILRHVTINQTTFSRHNTQPSQVRPLLSSVQIWLLTQKVIFVSAGADNPSAYGTTLAHSFDYDSKQAALLNTPGGAIAFVLTSLAALAVRHHVLQRWAVFLMY